MGQDPSTGGPEVTGTPDPEQIESEIERTRAELGDTMEALAQKTDVKAQAQRKVQETKSSVADKKDEVLGKAREATPDSAGTAAAQASQKARENRVPLIVAGAFLAGLLLGRARRG